MSGIGLVGTCMSCPAAHMRRSRSPGLRAAPCGGHRVVQQPTGSKDSGQLRPLPTGCAGAGRVGHAAVLRCPQACGSATCASPHCVQRG